MNVKITDVSPFLEKTKTLFKLLDEHNLSHCLPEICHLTQPEEMNRDNSTLLGVFLEGKLIGMGGLKYFDDYAEVTRMFILEDYRGEGFASKLLEELKNKALERNLKILRLETSEKFISAVKLYKKLGFIECEPFGEYINKAHNSYYEKNL